MINFWCGLRSRWLTFSHFGQSLAFAITWQTLCSCGCLQLWASRPLCSAYWCSVCDVIVNFLSRGHTVNKSIGLHLVVFGGYLFEIGYHGGW